MSGLFGGGGSAPAPAKSATMPTPDDQAIKDARRRSIAEQMKRSGRQSTILSDGLSDKLG